ncbi:DUF3152 domain-containing protein [Streptomyces sp. KLOTTS4A1]|uniref:DUF3152 domain-containing protein n=1 Tax=Streptomyces sp. KLOTTS4A1 TaxID=3390996 RepID=UPI0039F5BCEE
MGARTRERRPVGRGEDSGGGRGRGRGKAAARRRGARGGRVVLGALALSSGAALAYWEDERAADSAGGATEEAESAAEASPSPSSSPSPSPTPSPSVSPNPSASPSPSANPSKKASPKPSPSPEKPSTIPVPETGPGTFDVAEASGATVGSGSRVRRYKVLVEDGIAIDSDAAAAEVSAILADRRGWTRDGVNSFRLVSSGSYDFVVKIATPGTTDEICGAAGLLTRGEVNCSVGKDVVVNLKRWVLGSPQFDGPIDGYRALIVNHEVGHRIGHGHETCPGEGRPAPAMMQQIKGLKGCVSNAWPYEADGTYLGGPAVP